MDSKAPAGFLSCNICLEPFSEAALHFPRSVPCGHTFCHGCLTQLAKMKGSCPECRNDFGIVPAEAQAFPPNYAILNLLRPALASNVARPSPSPSPPKPKPKPKCVDCDDKEASLFCATACGDLCDECSTAIHSRRALRSHVLMEIAQKPSPVLRCGDHDEPLKLYCLTCEALACLMCKDFGEHAQHKIKPVSVAAAERKLELNSSVVELRAELKQTEGQIVSQQSHVQSDSQKALHSLSEAEQLCMEKLHLRCEALRLMIQSKAKEAEHTLAVLHQVTKECSESLQQLQSEVESQAGPPDDVTSMQLYSRVTAFSKQIPREVPPTRLQTNFDAQLLLETIASWGIVDAPLPPAQVIVEEDEEDEEKVRDSHRVLVRWGEQKFEGNTEYTVELQGPLDKPDDEKKQAAAHVPANGKVVELPLEGKLLEELYAMESKVVYQGREVRCKLDGLAFSSLYAVKVCSRNAVGPSSFTRPVVFSTPKPKAPAWKLSSELKHPAVAITDEGRGSRAVAGIALGYQGFVCSTLPMSRGRHAWSLHTNVNAGGEFIFCGVVDDAYSASLPNSTAYANPGAWGFCSTGYEYRMGGYRVCGQALNFGPTDSTLYAVLDCDARTLTVSNHATRARASLDLMQPRGSWLAMISLSGAGTSVTVTPLNEADVPVW